MVNPGIFSSNGFEDFSLAPREPHQNPKSTSSSFSLPVWYWFRRRPHQWYMRSVSINDNNSIQKGQVTRLRVKVVGNIVKGLFLSDGPIHDSWSKWSSFLPKLQPDQPPNSRVTEALICSRFPGSKNSKSQSFVPLQLKKRALADGSGDCALAALASIMVAKHMRHSCGKGNDFSLYSCD